MDTKQLSKPPTIERVHLVRTLETLLDGETQTVVLEGVDGIGKTTLLRQFHATFPERTFSLSVSGAAWSGYEVVQLELDLASQISQRLRGRALTDDEAQEHRKTYSGLLTQLDRLSKRTGQTSYIIIDGLQDLEAASAAFSAQVLALLPFAYDGLRFLISGELASLPLSGESRLRAKPWLVTYFTRDEAEKYLSPLTLNESQRQAIYSASRGVPGYLASIWRRIAGNANVEKLLVALPGSAKESFEGEWTPLGHLSEATQLAVATAAFENTRFALGTLASLVGEEVTVVRKELAKLSFIEITADDRVGFVSEAFRHFVADHSGAHRQRCNDLIIDFLLSDPESESAVAQLSTLYARTGRFADLLNYLSPERFARIYQRSPTLTLVQEKAEEGIAAARALKQDSELVRFTIQKSAIEEIARSHVGVSEVKAMCSLGDFEGAMAIANAVPRLELRLRLLAAIGKMRRDGGLPEDDEVTSQIRDLCAVIDAATLADALARTASDLFATAPDLAIELLKKASRGAGENSLDWAWAAISIQALLDTARSGKDKATELSAQIQDPVVRRFSLDASVVLGKQSAADVVREAGRVEATGDKLYLLQRWMSANRDRADAIEVLEHGIRLALQATGYSASARVYRELAACLPYVTESHSVVYFTGVIDAQRSELERIGPADDFVRLQLIMARAEWKHDRAAASNRFAEAYNAICRIPNLEIRTGCIARLVAALARTDVSRELEQEHGLHSLARQELEDGVKALLAASAEQLEAFRSTIQALSVAEPETALRIVGLLNTELRRDYGYSVFVDSVSDVPMAEVKSDRILAGIQAIIHPEIRDDAIEGMVASVRRREVSEVDLPRLQPLCECVCWISDLNRRIRAAAELLGMLPGPGDSGTESEAGRVCAESLTKVMEDGWAVLDPDWMKLELGYDVIVALATSRKFLAAQFVDHVNDLKGKLLIGDSETAMAATMSLRLAIRAYGGLSAKHLSSDIQRRRLLLAIQQVGTTTERAQLLGELAIQCYVAGRKGECDDLVVNHLHREILGVANENPDQRWRTIIDTAPALYVGGAATGLNMVKTLPPALRGRALGRIAMFLLRGTSPWDAYESRPGSGYAVTFEGVNQVLQVLKEIDEDWRLYDLIRNLIDSVTGVHGAALKRAQKAELVRQLDDMIAGKFEDERFIRHAGYKIITRAQLNRLREPGAVEPTSVLVAETMQVPNATDRAYILAILAATVSTTKERKAICANAREVVEQLPMLADRIDVYHTLGVTLVDVDDQQSKEALKTAYELSLHGEGESMAERRRSLIDLACRLHPELAGSLAAMTDDDPAKQRIEGQIRLHKIKDTIAKRRPSGEPPQVTDVYEWSRAAWLKLGSLVAGRASPVNPAHALSMLDYATKQPLSKSYPILAWFIENAIRFQRGTEKTKEYIGPLFEACLLGSELAFRASARAGMFTRPLEVSTAGVVIDRGNRNEGIEYIKDWLTANAPSELWIVEPYFVPENVEVLALVSECCEECTVFVLAGRSESLKDAPESPEILYRKAWRRIRSEEPPATNIILARSRAAKKFPIHDRWWLTKESGLSLGTSFSGIGWRLSEIRTLSRDEALARLEILRPYFNMTKMESDGERLEYLSCSL